MTCAVAIYTCFSTLQLFSVNGKVTHNAMFTPVTPGWRPYWASTATENGSRARQGRHKGLFTPKTHVFSAADILLRIYQNPMHLNGTRWRTTFWRQREVRRRKKR